jgi:glycosyltransferase involved in cell wall biosynthesis
MPEHEFIIYTIVAEEKSKGKFKYKLPSNVVLVKEIFLDFYLKDTGQRGKRFSISLEEKEAIKALICGKNFEWGHIFNFLLRNKKRSVSDFLLNKNCFNIILQAAEERYPYLSFNEFFWTIRSMILTLFGVIKNDLPEADLYHTVSTGYAGIIASLGRYIYGSPMILTEHGIYTREREEEIIKADWVKGYFKDTWINYFYSLSRCAYDYADIVISLFEKNREIQIEIGCSEEKTRVIPNGIDFKSFNELESVRKESSTINIASILRVVPIKDIKTLIQAFQIASEEVRNMRLFIMGPTDEDEEYTRECDNLVQSLGINNIVFTEQINVKEFIANMDILMLSSISEGMPLSVLEGMAAKKPHILTDVGSCRQLMYGKDDEFKEAGIIVPVMDVQAMASAIIKLAKSKKLREELGENAYSRVKNIYTLEKFIMSYKELYKEMEGKNHGRGRV